MGRREELQAATRVLERSRAGQSNTLILGGEAGIGKSRLVEELLGNANDVTTKVLSAGCIDCGEAPLPFGPVVEALRPLNRKLDADSRRELFDPLRAELARVLPILEASGPTQSSEGAPTSGSRPQLFEMVLSLLEGMSQHGLVVVVFEDLHWADRSTLDLLAFLVANLSSVRVALVLTYRSDELPPGHELLRYWTQMQRNRSVTRLHLQRLDRSEIISHLEDFGGSPVDHQVVQQIWERSQGNPFYAEELLSASADTGSSQGVPLPLTDMLLARIKGLPALTQTVLRAASAGGRSIDHRVLQIVLDDGITTNEIDEALRSAVDRRVLINDSVSGQLEFRHALLREVAYADMLPGERERIHARYAQWLRDLDESEGVRKDRAAELARHYAQAHDSVHALAAFIHAAEIAEQARGYAEAHVHLDKALKLWDAVPASERPVGIARVELLERCGRVSHLEGDDLSAVKAARAALELTPPDGERALSLSVRLGCYLQAAGESEEALVVLDIATKHSLDKAATPLDAEALSVHAQLQAAGAQHRESLHNAQRALEIARTCRDRARESQALTIIGSNLVVLGEPDEGVESLKQALRLAEELEQPTEVATGYCDLAATLSGPLNRLEEALAIANEGIERVQRYGLERHWGVTLRSIAADTLFRMGRWDEADDAVEDAIRRSPRGAAALDLFLARAKLEVGRGEFVGARRDLDTVRSLTARSIDLRYKVPLHTLEAGLALWQNRIDDASVAVRAGLQLLEATDDVWFFSPLIWHGMRAEAERVEAARSDASSTAASDTTELGEELRAMSRESGRSGQQRGALRLVLDAYDLMCEGELRRIRGEAADDVWKSVADSWDALGQPYPAAYARAQWAQALLQKPSGIREAAAVMREAHEMARALRANPLVESIEAIAQRAGVELEWQKIITLPANAVDLTGPRAADLIAIESQLTKREKQILELVAAGRSNRDIASECFISEKTASVHVSNIMRKLGVGSRVQAAALLHEMQRSHHSQ